MLLRFAVWCLAAFLAAWPVRSGIDVGTLVDFHAAALEPAPDTAADAAAARSQGDFEADMQKRARDGTAAQVATLDKTPAPASTATLCQSG